MQVFRGQGLAQTRLFHTSENCTGTSAMRKWLKYSFESNALKERLTTEFCAKFVEFCTNNSVSLLWHDGRNALTSVKP